MEHNISSGHGFTEQPTAGRSHRDQAVRWDGNAVEIDFQLPASPPIKFAGRRQADLISGEAKLPVAPFTAKIEMKRGGPLAKLPVSPASKGKDDNLAPLSDEFESGASLKNWKNLAEVECLPNRIEKMEFFDGKLCILPGSGAWWAGYHGIYLLKR
jgi:hypothetical protein